ncbi:MAG: transporter [Flavobacteriales bacterium]|nr:transporter [Flavobacteriales bacterium]
MKHHYFFLTLLSILLLPQALEAQTAETIRTGRPGQSIGAFSLGDGLFQIQSGVYYNPVEFDGFDQTIYGNNTVLRYGITELFEISGVFDQVEFRSDEIADMSRTSIQLGGRYHLLDQQGIIPNVALQSRLSFSDLSDAQVGTVSILSTTINVLDNYTFFTNWKMITMDGVDEAAYAYTVNLSRSLSDRIGVFVEMYGSLSDFSSNFDTGLGYLVNDDLQLDISFGIQDQDGVQDRYIDAGISWRITPD